MSTKLLELDRRYFDAWHNHDADAIAAAFAENSNYTHPALPEPLVGGPAVAEWAKTVWTILPDFKLDLVSRDAEGCRFEPCWVQIQPESRFAGD